MLSSSAGKESYCTQTGHRSRTSTGGCPTVPPTACCFTFKELALTPHLRIWKQGPQQPRLDPEVFSVTWSPEEIQVSKLKELEPSALAQDLKPQSSKPQASAGRLAECWAETLEARNLFLFGGVFVVCDPKDVETCVSRIALHVPKRGLQQYIAHICVYKHSHVHRCACTLIYVCLHAYI